MTLQCSLIFLNCSPNQDSCEVEQQECQKRHKDTVEWKRERRAAHDTAHSVYITTGGGRRVRWWEGMMWGEGRWREGGEVVGGDDVGGGGGGG